VSIRDRPGYTVGAELAVTTLEALRDKYSPEQLEALLNQKADGVNMTNLDVLRQALTPLGVVTGSFDNYLSKIVFDEVSAPGTSEKFQRLLAKLLNYTPAQLARKVEERIDTGAVNVPKDEFIAATANTAIERKTLTEEDRAALRALPDTLRKLGLESIGDLAARYVKLFEELSGSPSVFEPNNPFNLFQHHGDHVRAYLRHEVRLALLPSATEAKAETVDRFERFTEQLLKELDGLGLLPTTGIIADGSDVGLSGAMTRCAEAFPEVHRGGLGAGAGWEKAPALVDRLTMFGDDPNGAAVRELFWDWNATATLVVVDPSAADVAKIKENAKAGGEAIVLYAEKKPSRELANVKGVETIDLNAGADISKAAAEAATYIRARRNKKRATRPMSVAEHSTMSKAPDKIRQVRLWAKEESTKYRLIRLKNQVLAELRESYPQAELADLTKWSMDFAGKLISHTHGIDNFKNNKDWQAAAHRAIDASCQEVKDIHAKLGLSIMFASWFGIREFEEEPSYFDQKKSDLSSLEDFLKDVDKNMQHIFDQDVYAEVRLDAITCKFLAAKDSRPEIFLGSREEMQLYYRARGYEFDATTHDSNGTFFHYFRSTKEGQEPVMVIHGLDSEARMAQLAGLMKVNGLDPERCIVRGEMSRVREVNRSLLQHRISEIITHDDVQMPIAGVVVGNKNESIDALLERAGVSKDQATITSHSAGPFRFTAIEVKAEGSDVPQVILAFAPAYGQLTEDLAEVTATLGCQNFLNLGAGGSLNPNDKLNEIHQVEEVFYGGRRIGFADTENEGVEKSKFLRKIEVPAGVAKRSVNWFSPSPLQQNLPIWVPRTRHAVLAADKPTADVDQETGALHAGLHRASLALNGLKEDGAPLLEGLPTKGRTLNLQSTLVQTQIINARDGSGGNLATSTVGVGYAQQAKEAARLFFDALGVGAVACRDGYRTIAGAEHGYLHEQDVGVVATGIKSVEKIMPNMTGQIADWAPGIEQLRGERRMLIVRGEKFGPEEQRALEKTLERIDPSDCFVVVDASDRHNREIRDAAASKDGASSPKSRMIRRVAQQYGFETTVLALESEQSSVEGAFHRLLSFADPLKKAEAYAIALSHRNAEQDPNYSIPINLVLGAERPEAHTLVDPPHGFTATDCDSFVNVLSAVHDEVFAERYNAEDAKGKAALTPDKKAAYQIEQRDEVLKRVAERWPDAKGSDAAKVRDLFEYLVKKSEIQGYFYTGGMKETDVDTMAAWIKREFDFALEGGERMFGNGLTHRTPGLRNAIADRYRQNLADGLTRVLPARTGEQPLDAPKIYRLEELDQVFGVAGTDRTRKAFWMQGASRDSWPLLSAQSRYALHLLAELTPKLMREKKDEYVPVDGATDWGWEKLLNDAFARDGWHVLGTISQNTLLGKDEWELAPSVHRFVVTGMDWTGVATPVIEHIMSTYGGLGMLAGGGFIAKLQAESQLAHGTPLKSITGLTASDAGLAKVVAAKQKKENKAAQAEKREPRTITVADLSEVEKRNAAGASVELGEQFASSGIATLDEYCRELGCEKVLAQMLRAAGLSADHQIRIQDDVPSLERLAKSASVDTKQIKRQYME
jgi:hypothetical protein